jgi:hypothetical protein
MNIIHTAAELRKKARRLDQKNLSVAGVLSAMRAGAALHLEHRPGGERWWLSDGSQVAAGIAHLVIRHPDVAGVGDCLFGFTPAQTYRFVNNGN